MTDTSKTAKIIKGDIIQQHIDAFRCIDQRFRFLPNYFSTYS